MHDDSAEQQQVRFLANASDTVLKQYALSQRALAADLLKTSRETFFAASRALAQAEAATFLVERRGELTARTLQGVYLQYPSAK